ncbi:MAG: hypothetical protein ACO223_08365, partial [Burkholderiaceae bacterium]
PSFLYLPHRISNYSTRPIQTKRNTATKWSTHAGQLDEARARLEYRLRVVRDRLEPARVALTLRGRFRTAFWRVCSYAS